MSAKDQVTRAAFEMIFKTLPTDYEIQNPVSQFLSDSLDMFLEDSEMRTLMRVQLVTKANDDPNGVLTRLVDLHNDHALEEFHNGIGELVKDLSEAEDVSFDRREVVVDRREVVEEVLKEVNGDGDVESSLNPGENQIPPPETQVFEVAKTEPHRSDGV